MLSHLPPSLMVLWQADDGPWDEARAVIADVCWSLEDAALVEQRLRLRSPGSRVRVIAIGSDAVVYDTGQDADEWRADAEQERSRPAHAQELPRRRRGEETS